MDKLTNEKRARKPYRIVGPRVWAVVEKRYLAGESARKVAGDLGVTESALRARARRKGWTKRALAEAQADAVIAGAEALDAADAALWADVDGGAEALTPAETARRALAMAARLLRQGRMLEAAAAARVAEAIGRAAMRLPASPEASQGEDEDDEALLEAVRRKVAALTSPSAKADGEDRSRSDQEGAAPAGRADATSPLNHFAVLLPSWRGGDVGAQSAETEPPPPGGCAAGPPHSPDANGEVKP